SGLSVALSDSLPVLAITGFEPSYGIGKGGLGETTGLNRTPDSQTLFAAITKKTYMIEHADQACDVLEEAVNTAYEGRPGPVHIHLPFDISHDEVSNYRDIKLEIKPVEALPKEIRQFAEALSGFLIQDKKIIALVGYGCIRSNAQTELIQLLETFQIPFMTTMDAKGIFPESHPLYLGMTGAAGDPGAKKALVDADVVLALGNSFSKWQTWRWVDGVYNTKTLMQINIDKQARDRVYHADYFLLSDIKLALINLLKELSLQGISREKITINSQKHTEMPLDLKPGIIHPGTLAMEIAKYLPGNSILLGDAGSHMLWLAAYVRMSKYQNYQNPGIFGPMAANVNAAIGTQLATPDRRVIVGCGDGDYQMAGFELMTAVENKIPIIWIIFNNGEYNIIKMMHLKNFNGREVYNHFLNPDFVAYAKACGANGFRVEKIEDFGPAFESALKDNKPSIIDVVVDPDTKPPFGLFVPPQ
ncbi:MAG: thiamine pyrophosphate-binding protein, partial [Prolixibacteraceae bacterium]|nr:thiamine pyrophosphate-binding protein [Prolixibacteraceae bacterium]